MIAEGKLNKTSSDDFPVSQDKQLNEDEKRLAEAKTERLKMENAAVTLENRILYLEKLTSKMNRKIQSAKNRVNEIMKLKKQSLEEQESRKQHIEKKEISLLEKRNRVQEFKANQEEKLNKSKIDHMAQSYIVAKNTKEDLQVSSKVVERKVQTTERRSYEDESVECASHSRYSQECCQ